MGASLTSNNTGRGLMAINLTGVTGTGNGGIGAVLNPEGVDVLITRCFLYVGTASTGAANLSCGVGATATTPTSDIISALAVNGVTGNYYNGQAQQVTAKTQVSAPATWSASKYIVFTGSADTTGFVGTLFVEYVRTA
jgi:hypothetical protein